MYLLTTILIILFSIGSVVTLYILISMFFGTIQTWKAIFIFGILLLLIIIRFTMPSDYYFPFNENEVVETTHKGEPQ